MDGGYGSKDCMVPGRAGLHVYNKVAGGWSAAAVGS